MFLLVLFLFAALCYHYKDLDECLAPTNQLRVAPLFIAAEPEIRQFATVKYHWSKTDDTPIFTGVPPHVLLLSEMEVLKQII